MSCSDFRHRSSPFQLRPSPCPFLILLSSYSVIAGGAALASPLRGRKVHPRPRGGALSNFSLSAVTTVRFVRDSPPRRQPFFPYCVAVLPCERRGSVLVPPNCCREAGWHLPQGLDSIHVFHTVTHHLFSHLPITKGPRLSYRATISSFWEASLGARPQ